MTDEGEMAGNLSPISYFFLLERWRGRYCICIAVAQRDELEKSVK